MNSIKKIETYEELDKILPLIDKFCKAQKYYELFPVSGYYAWLYVNFPSLGVWGMFQDDKPVGYSVVGVQYLNTVPIGHIHETFCELKYSEFPKDKLVEAMEEWARERGCKLMACFTEYDKLADTFVNRYDFEINQTYLTKRL